MKRIVGMSLLVSVLLVVGLLAAGATPAAADTTANQNITADEIANEWSLAELQRDGAAAPNAPASVRSDGEKMYWLIHWPATLLGSDAGEPDGDEWEFLERGATVERNSVYLRSIGDREEVTVTIVMYNEGEREITEDNSTTTIAAPENVRVFEEEIVLEQGWSFNEIDLPRSEEPRQVTMWVEGAEDDLRWTFQHDSIATTEPVDIDTEGDYWSRLVMDLLLPVLLGMFGVGASVRWALKRAGKGTGWGFLRWGFLILGGSAALMFVFYSSITEILIDLPQLGALVLVAIFGVLMLEGYEQNTRTVCFKKPELQKATSPSGNDAYDVTHTEEAYETLTRMPDGRLAVVRDGLRPFLARVFGGAAYIDNHDAMDTRVKVTGPVADEEVLVSPRADTPIEYQAEGWKLELPDIDTRDDIFRVAAGLAIIAAFGVISATLSGHMVIGVIVSTITALVLVARPTSGYASIEAAPGHLRSAWYSSMYLEKEIEDAEVNEELRKENVKQQAKSEKEVQRALVEQDVTLVEEMLQGDIDRGQLPVDESPAEANGGDDDE